MRDRSEKRGNSLGPKSPLGNTEVESTVSPGTVLVEAVAPRVTLEALLDYVTDDNRHDEVSWGKRVGKEIW